VRNRTGWQYAAAGLFIAGIAAVVSYRDGLFVARLAGNHDDQAYLYPFLPDGLIVVCLLALYEASRARAGRPRWAMGGLVLGIMLTLAQNVYAGLAHTVLDAVLDGMVPVVFFIAVEVVLWHVRRSRGAAARGDLRGSPAASRGMVPSSSLEAAKARMRQAAELGFRYSDNEARAQFGLTRAQAAEARRQVTAGSPAGDAPRAQAGASGRDGPSPPTGVPAALNGQAPHG
jgi:Protein of unknown function (DUF2637)